MWMKGCEAAQGQQCYNALPCIGGEKLISSVLDLDYLHHDLVMLQLLCLAHFVILADQDHHQNLILSSLSNS